MIYVTGAPGTGIAADHGASAELALEKYVRYKSGTTGVSATELPVVLKLEDRLWALAGESVRSILDQEPTRYRALQLPKSLLQRLWREAFRACLDEAKIYRDGGRDVFLTLHACWYHVGTREYISALDFRLLSADDARGEAVITLIDDIYDVHARLSTPTALFRPRVLGPPKNGVDDLALADIVLKLLRILEWRALEITVSDRIASAACSGKHRVFAVKHPLRTFDALVNSDRPLVYLSHPISEIRKWLETGGKKADEGQAFIRGIRELADSLAEVCTVLEPTAIDEFRLNRTIAHEGKDLRLPSLQQRWDLPAAQSDLLWVAPPASDPFGEEWRKQSAEIQVAAVNKVAIPHTAELDVARPSIETLAEQIHRQITSRDFTLVEEAECLVVYRPFHQGHQSRGVEREIDHHARLRRAGIHRGQCIVLHPPSDESLRRPEMLATRLNGWLGTGELCGSLEGMEAARADLLPFANDPKSVTDLTEPELGRKLTEILARHSIEVMFVPPTGGLAREAAPNQEDSAEILAHEFLKALGPSYLDKFENDSQITVIREELTPHAFAARVGAILANTATLEEETRG